MYRRIRHRRISATTNYKKRIAQLKSGMNRLVVRKSNRGITVQAIAYEENGDKIIAYANSKELKAKGWEPRCNIPTAYLTGMLLAAKIKDKQSEFILDIGLYRPVKGSVIFAAAKGFADSGAKLRNALEFDEARLSGSHISKYAAGEGKDKFTGYAKAGFDAKSIENKFNAVKKELNSSGK
jgi:large subunit ribosomal protein L18